MTVTMMDAMLIDRFGEPEELYLGQVKRPIPGPTEVLIELAYAAVNPADWKVRSGWLGQHFTPEFPFILGFDGAGVVAEVGSEVKDLKPGDRVVAASNQGKGEWGSYAQFMVADVDRTVLLPSDIRLRDAATLPTAGMTAWEAVHDVGQVKPGMHVFVHGGSGGTGSFAIQLAVAAGACVSATASASNLRYLRTLGAVQPIDYTQDDLVESLGYFAPNGVDLVIDTVGQNTLKNPLALIAKGGCYAPIATLVQDEEPISDDAARACDIRVSPVSSTFPNQGRQLRGLVKALAAGDIRPPDHYVLPLHEAAEAHRRSQDGHVRGKILLRVNDRLGR